MAVDLGPDGTLSRNRLLTPLPAADIELLQPHMQRVKLTIEQVLHESNEPFDHVFFLDDGIASMTADTKDNGAVEVGVASWDGMVGTAAILHPEPVAVHRVIIQVSGTAIRMRTGPFRKAMERSPAFRDRCLRFVQFVLVQTAQAAACNVRHELPERLARWLLTCWDRHDQPDLPMRQEFLALMLGVRRPGVSAVVGALQATGAIRQSRGRLTLLDRGLLEAEACSCYRLIEDSRRRILAPLQAGMH